jgi:hypothetical protein
MVLIFGISSGPLPTAESPMQPMQPESTAKLDVPKLKPTVFKTVAELTAEPLCDPDVHLSRVRSTNLWSRTAPTSARQRTR